ncbi:MAG: STAS domain-containing protein [Spirochaetes bacterium]|nr:STAS domain-containing protein [Spirochaetota bacterium]
MDLDTKIPESKKDVTIVNLKGRLDVHYSTELENALNALIDQGKKKILLSLADVEYLSSSGLRVFIAISRRLKEVGGEFKLMKLNETTKKIFKIVELIDMFDIFETEEDAVKSFS